MAREGKTGLTLKDSTHTYADELKTEYNDQQTQQKRRITWDDVVLAGMADIEEKGVVNNPVTTPGDPRSISIHDETYDDVHPRKEEFPLDVTWDDIVVHGIQRATDEEAAPVATGGLSKEAADQVREIVDERIDERLGDLEAMLQEELEDVEAGVTENRAKEISREVSRQVINDIVADGAIQPQYR